MLPYENYQGLRISGYCFWLYHYAVPGTLRSQLKSRSHGQNCGTKRPIDSLQRVLKPFSKIMTV